MSERNPIDPSATNHDFMLVLDLFKRHLSEPHVYPLRDLKDAISAFLESWLNVLKDMIISTKIELFRLAADLLDPAASPEASRSFGQKLAARRFLTDKADLHIEELCRLFQGQKPVADAIAFA